MKPVVDSAEELRQLELQIKRAELEEIELRKKEREFSLQDLKARVSERELKETQRRNDREQQGRTFAQQAANNELKWKNCTHKKGGKVKNRDMSVLTSGGNSDQYAVIKHQMITGDIWVKCLRCGKWWAPPVKSNFYFDKRGKQVPQHMGEFSKEKFSEAVAEYNRAVRFETNNTMSGSVQAKFYRFNPETDKMEDATDEYRELLRDSAR